MNEHWNSLCPGCFEDKRREPVCPHCGYDESAKRGPLVLPHRTLLQGQYLVGRVLGKPGGFGITYLAYDTQLETRVAIKEYLPRDLAGRESSMLTVSAHSPEDGELFRYGLEQFLREARTLAKFDHAHVVRVRNVFEENGTAYLVMDYYDGTTLAEYLHRKGKLPEKTALDILMPILDGLREVHDKGFLHRDIKPQNIYLTNQGRPILLDFGSARVAMGERSKSLSVVLSPGYAPFEQYHRRGDQGPWTDVYACAAVLYQMVTGDTPPEAPERSDRDELVPPQKLTPQLSAHVAQAILRGLALNIRERPQTVREFQDQLMQRVSWVSSSPRSKSEASSPLIPLYVGFWKRCAAMMVDAVVLAFLGLLLVFLMQIGVTLMPSKPDKASIGIAFLASVAILPWIYYAWMESSSHQATIGKMALRMKVVDARGERISFWRASGRFFGKIISVWTLMAGYVMAAFTARKRTLHDRLAKCWVVRKTATPEQVRQESVEDSGMPRPLAYGLVVLLIGVAGALGYLGTDGAGGVAGSAAGSASDDLGERANGGDAEAQQVLADLYVEGREFPKDNAEALKWYRKAAEQGRIGAQVMLGWMYDKGLGTEVNYEEALRWYRMAANKNNPVAQERLSILYRLGRGVPRDADEAERWANKTAALRKQVAEWYRKLADWGDPAGQNNLGSMYINGDGVAKDVNEGMRWYRKAADQGLKEAQSNLGRMYFEGDGVAKNYQEALKWYGKAAEQSDSTAQTRIGWMHSMGQGTAKDQAQALKWFRAAAEQGDAWGQSSLGEAYANGYGVAKDDDKAAQWFLKAAEGGNAAGQYYLGIAYQYGRGLPNDDKRAVKWYRESAEQGLGDAQINLGWMYSNGRGVAKNYTEAVRWYRKAADQGLAMAQSNMGVMYENGWGVSKDLNQAVTWYRKAAGQGYENAKKALARLNK